MRYVVLSENNKHFEFWGIIKIVVDPWVGVVDGGWGEGGEGVVYRYFQALCCLRYRYNIVWAHY